MNTCLKCGTTYEGAEMFCPKDGTRLGGSREMQRVRASSIPPEIDPLIGKVIQKRYRVISQLGEGGMGVVYIAEHVEIEKKVALKVLREDFSKRPEVVERFRQEARSASKIGHPHIVDVTDFGQLDNGGVYFVMEYLRGKSLSDIIRDGPVSIERTVNIVKQIAKALQAAHDLGIVHRDLKPENVFLVSREENEDFVKILDFGIAKISDRDSQGERLTKTGMIFGTPEYMSPEQAAGRELDHRVDVYALGCIMFEMFTGTVPFDGETFMAVLTQHMFEPVPPIEEFCPSTDAPVSVRNVVYKAMAKDAEERYPDMEALEQDLERALLDAGYIVDVPRADQSVRLATNGLRKAGLQMGGDDKETQPLSGWTPITGVNAGRQNRSIRPYIVGVIVLFLLLGVGGLYLITSEKTGENDRPGSVGQKIPPVVQEEAQIVNLTGKSDDVHPAESEKQDSAQENKDQKDNAAESFESDKIVVVVNTEPKNGVISIEGMGQVCSSAPCEIQLSEGEPVEIEARLGNKIARQTFTPSSQNKRLILEMKSPVKRGAKRPRKKDGRPNRGQKTERKKGKRDKTAGELKIPGIFKDN